MVYDLLMYSGEDNILEIRLNELKDIVDKFIILESPKSHTRIPKPFYFSYDRFKDFNKKIDYFTYDYCVYDNPFYNDHNGRILLYQATEEIHSTGPLDFILAGDLDEIPNSEILKKELENYTGPTTLLMKNRVLCLDLEQKGLEFPGTSILKPSFINSHGIHFLRDNRQNSHRNIFKLVDNAGWHFTYCAGLEKTLNKMKYFAHANETGAWAKTKEELIECIKNDISVDKSTKLVRVDANELPKYVIDNQERFKENLSFNYD